MRFVISNYDHYSNVSEMLLMLHLSRLEGGQNAHSSSVAILQDNSNILIDVSLPDCSHNNKFIPMSIDA